MHNPNPAGTHGGMVTSPHALASEAGRDVLRAGGNAIEAAIAIGAALCVTYPHFTGLGGDAFWVIGDRQGTLRTLSGIGQAAAQLPAFNGAIPLRGPASAITTAATVDTWNQAYEISQSVWGGMQSWSSLFDRAHELAADGFPVTPSQHFWQTMRADELQALPGFAATFAPHGPIPAIDERFVQPALAKSIERIARFGAREFYEGDLAERIADGLRQAGSPLTASDLARTHARNEAPLRVAYRGGELVSLQPPTQGVTTLQIMGTLERFDLGSIPEGSADYYHLLVEAVKCAFVDRDRFVCDPEFNIVPVEEMLSPATLDAHARSIHQRKRTRMAACFPSGRYGIHRRDGSRGPQRERAANGLLRLGSGVVAGDTGILWHNRGALVQHEPRASQRRAARQTAFPYAQPRHVREGRPPATAVGTQGADGQPQRWPRFSRG